MLGHLEGMLGLCWAYVRPLLAHLGVCWRLSWLKFQSQRKHGSVGIEFWVGFGLMLGHLEAMLGLCWNITNIGSLLEYKTVFQSILATHLGLATRMQKKFLIYIYIYVCIFDIARVPENMILLYLYF